MLFSLFCVMSSAYAMADAGRDGAVRARLKSLIAAIGPCADCSVSAIAREAGDAPLGVAPVKDLHGRNTSVSVVNDEFALKLFQEMTVQRKIPFGFPEDGCYARAHEMSYQLDKKKIETAKIFATGLFRLDNGKAESGIVTWGFHVAPVLIVDDGKTKSLLVIDPSLFLEPASVEDWLMKLTSHNKARLDSAFITNRYVYHLKHKDRRLTEFDSNDLAAAQRLMRRYRHRDADRTRRKFESD